MSLRNVVTASVVRRIYARLLSLGEDLGKGRAASETPLEYLENLQLLFPDHREQARTITRAYVHVRYGEFPEEGVDLDKVRESWATLKEVSQSKRPIRLERG
jgi:hypothetical protein